MGTEKAKKECETTFRCCLDHVLYNPHQLGKGDTLRKLKQEKRYHGCMLGAVFFKSPASGSPVRVKMMDEVRATTTAGLLKVARRTFLD